MSTHLREREDGRPACFADEAEIDRAPEMPIASTTPVGRRSIPGLVRVRELIGRDRTDARRYGVALAVTALAVLAAMGIDFLASVHTNLLLVTAVAISAWYGGRGPGALASALSVIAIVLLLGTPSPNSNDVRGVGEAVYLATFLVVAMIIGMTTESLRRERAQAVTRATRLEELNAEVEQQIEEVQTLSEDLCRSNEALTDALEAAEDQASRAMRLQEATAALAKAQTESDVADVVLGQGLAAVGAMRGFLARADGDGAQILRASGYDPAVQKRLLARTAENPLLIRAMKTGEAIWVRSEEEHRARYQRLYDRLGITTVPRASASIPLRHGDSVVGALGLFFAEPSNVGPETEAFSLLLGQAAADALSRARSYDAERAGRETAEMIAQARADVLGVVAHDLRNPLHVIAASAGLLLEASDLSPAERRRPLEITQRAVRRMNRLIGDLLDATHLQAGRITLALRDVDAIALVREARETLRPAAEERHIELLAEPPARESLLRADEDRLLQVLGNLIGNALKFTAVGGRVVISARPADVEVVFSVADNGPGIPEEHQTHLFDRFWQARDGDRRGVGLGLTITKGIVEAHGGRVWVESVVGTGSTFLFAIPTAHVATPDTAPSPQ